MSLSATSIPPDGTPAATPPYGGLLRNGNPSGNPNAAPRCGAKNRGGKPCRAPAMANGRCRCHGGKSTGPRSPKGIARMTAAHIKHGNTTASGRAEQRYVRALINRTRLTCQARDLRPYLPPAMAARLAASPPELWAPIHPSNLPFVQTPDPPPGTGTAPDRRHPAQPGAPARPLPRTLAAEREAARAEAAALAPWRQAIAAARAAKHARLVARRADRATRHAAWAARRAAKPQAAQAPAPAAHADTPPPVVWPPAPDIPWTDYTPLERELAARLAGVRARTDNGDQQAAPAPDPTSAFARINPVNPEPVATPAPNPTSAFSRINPLNPERATTPVANPNSTLSRINPVNPEPAATPAPSPNSTFSRINPLNPETGATPKSNPTSPPRRINFENPEPAAAPAAQDGSTQPPPNAHAPDRGPAASDAIPPGLPNRAARRRWKSLQRRLHRTPTTCAHP